MEIDKICAYSKRNANRFSKQNQQQHKKYHESKCNICSGH